jgi:hypothetical protein
LGSNQRLIIVDRRQLLLDELKGLIVEAPLGALAMPLSYEGYGRG